MSGVPGYPIVKDLGWHLLTTRPVFFSCEKGLFT